MKRLLFLPLIVLLLAACSQRHDNFVLEGSFKGFSQGELYIYGVNGAWPLDTIGVAKGKFRYAVPITEPTAFVIVFPNFAELLVMGEPGADVEIEGDASHLLQTKITGTKENEALTTFRRQNRRIAQNIPYCTTLTMIGLLNASFLVKFSVNIF